MSHEPKVMEQLPHEPPVECKECKVPKIKVAKAFLCCPNCDAELIQIHASTKLTRR